MKKLLGLLLIFAFLISVFSSCSTEEKITNVSEYKDWEQVLSEGRGKSVTIFMWGGNDGVNRYMDTYVAKYMKDNYDILVKRVPLSPIEYLPKLINEKKGSVIGTGDVLWINAENFLTAKSANLLSEPFTQLLPNQSKFYDESSSDINFDTGVPIEGREAIWGKAQLVFSYDESLMKNPPKNYNELLLYAKANPGKISFPKIPDDFVGTAFFRNAFYELAEEEFSGDMTKEEFVSKAEPVVEYFKELKPYLWNRGESFPSSQAQLDELFKNGEIHMTMGFEVGKTAGLVKSGVYPSTVKTFIFETGTIGNAHYLAIPFNSPEPAAAMVLIDFLQSPMAQIEKMKPEVWGDMPSFDYTKIDGEINKKVVEIEGNNSDIALEKLSLKRLPEMTSEQIGWIKEIWTTKVLG
ncbi:MAG: ABC transporter substrate-binding protein [Filifactoraceae bacterium]